VPVREFSLDLYPPLHQTYEERRAKGLKRASLLASRLGVKPEMLRGKRLLEIGCGYGADSVNVEEVYGANVIGIDPWPRWKRGPNRKRDIFHAVDIADPAVLNLGQFDYAFSQAVFEHVERPRVGLQNLFKLLKPGGRAFLKYNLYLGCSSSHLVKYIGLPWVQLTHSDAEVRALMLEKTGREQSCEFVNRASYAHYLRWFDDIGFKLLNCSYDVIKMSDEFYKQHYEKLKFYDRTDLETDFMLVLLERPGASVAQSSSDAQTTPVNKVQTPLAATSTVDSGPSAAAGGAPVTKPASSVAKPPARRSLRSRGSSILRRLKRSLDKT
jgi:SAM-dependent methyltransferase